jgi:hypothetical protein
MSTASDIEDGLKVAGDVIPVVAALAMAIAKIVDGSASEAEQLDALQTAAEAVKARMDALKFPNEPTT